MFLLIGEASMGLTKASILHARKHTHTHTHNYVRLASFWGEWTLNKATSWPPWKPRTSTEKHKEETGNPVQTQWHGNHELMSLGCHILSGCQIVQPWPGDAETIDQSVSCYSARTSHVCPCELSGTLRWWEVVCAACLVSDTGGNICFRKKGLFVWKYENDFPLDQLS